MSVRFVVAAVAAGVAAYVSGGSAAATTFSLVYGTTGFLDPNTKVKGPRLDDTKLASAAYGATVAYIEGHPRIAGNIVWGTDKREVANQSSQSGKGGPGVDTTTYTYEMDLMVLLSENPGVLVRRIWSNGALIWSAADDADAETLAASAVTTSWREIRFYDGNPGQLPDPTYEAAVGIGNAPAYRGRSSLVIVGLNLGNSGQLPVLTFEVVASSISKVTEGIKEDFEAGIGGYTVSGDAAVFEVIDADFGQALRVVGGDITPTSSSLARAIDVHLARRIAFKYRVDDLTVGANPDDGPQIVINGVDFDFSFDSAREKAYDSLRRPYININGTMQPVAPQLQVGQWYGVLLEIVSEALCRVTVTESGTGLVKQVTDFSGSFAESYHMTLLSFVDVGSNLGSDTKPTACFDQVEIGEIVTTVTAPETPLEQVVQRQWQRAGLDFELLDVTQLAGMFVRSMAVSQITSPRQILDSLAAAFMFEFVESDKVRAVRRGGAAVATIPYEDLGASTREAVSEPLPRTRGNELELPSQIAVKFSNVDDNYQDGSESSTRLATGSSITSVVEVPLGLTPTEAKRLAENQVTDALASIIRVGPFSVTRKWAQIEPTDVVILMGKDGSTYRTRIQKRTDAGGLITFDGVLDDATAVNSQAVTSGGYNNSTIVRQSAPTDLELLDIPALRDADTGAPGLYAAAKPASDGRWSGYALFRSVDDVSFDQIYEATPVAVIGTGSTTLGAFGGGPVFDERNTFTVNVGSGQLSSVTRDAILTSTVNAALVGAEVIQFRNAALVSTGVYTLSGLLRGRRGTEWAINGHLSNERFVLLRPDSLRRIVDQAADIGAPRWWKAATFGASLAATNEQEFTDTGVSLKPFSPVDLRASRSADSAITLSWKRRTRHSTNFTGPSGSMVPLGETEESYAVDILSAPAGSVKRTIACASSQCTYSSDMQVADFGALPTTIYANVYQISSAIGRGYPLIGQASVATLAFATGSSANFGMRPVMTIGSTILAANYSAALTTSNGGANYTVGNTSTPEAYAAGFLHFDAKLGTQRISVGFNEAANLAGLIVASTDATLATTLYANDQYLGNWKTQGYPRLAGGQVLRTLAFFGDGTYYWLMGREALSNTINTYMYQANASLAFGLIGTLAQDPTDPNALPPSSQGSFAAVAYGSCDLRRIGMRWFMTGSNAMYYTDDTNASSGWRRCPTGLGENVGGAVFLTPPQLIGTTLLVGGFLGGSFSNDQGVTWTRVAGLLAGYSFRAQGLGSTALLYYQLGSQVYVAKSTSPFSAWTNSLVVGVEFSAVYGQPQSVGDFVLDSSGSRLAAQALYRLVYSDDGITFYPATTT